MQWPVESHHWHPVAASEALADLPLAAELLGQALVLWRDAQGQPHAWADRCPHRGARLSLGRVCRGHLECPYHGWQFAPSTQCVRVPALPDFVPPATHRAHAYAACEAYGLVWVRLAPQADTPLPAFTPEADVQLRKLNCGPYEVQTSAPRIVENFLDLAHFSFVHDGWLGARSNPVLDDYATEATPFGFKATGCKAWQPRSNLLSQRPAQVAYEYQLTGPYSAVLTKLPEPGSTAKPGYRESIALFINPVAPEYSRVWFRLAVADFEASDDSLRAFQHTIFTQDQPVLESQSPKRLPLDVRAERHTAADNSAAAYRRHLAALGVGFGVLAGVTRKRENRTAS